MSGQADAGRSRDGPHETMVELTGEVVAADVIDRRFRLRTGGDGSVVVVSFSEEHEAHVTAALKGHREFRLRVRGAAEVSPAGEVERIERVEELELLPAREGPPRRPHRPIEEVIAEIAATVPDEEWAKVPADLSYNHDHYLYGTPKKPSPWKQSPKKS